MVFQCSGKKTSKEYDQEWFHAWFTHRCVLMHDWYMRPLECPVRVKEIGVAKVRRFDWPLYVEAIKRVKKTSDNTLCVKNLDFVAFIATVINCMAQVSNKSKKLDIFVTTSETFLGLLRVYIGRHARRTSVESHHARPGYP